MFGKLEQYCSNLNKVQTTRTMFGRRQQFESRSPKANGAPQGRQIAFGKLSQPSKKEQYFSFRKSSGRAYLFGKLEQYCSNRNSVLARQIEASPFGSSFCSCFRRKQEPSCCRRQLVKSNTFSERKSLVLLKFEKLWST